MIYAGFFVFSIFGWEDGPIPTFWLLNASMCARTWACFHTDLYSIRTGIYVGTCTPLYCIAILGM